jgi:hypothetical protein
MAEKDGYEEGRLRARPAAQTIGEATVGLRRRGSTLTRAGTTYCTCRSATARGAPLH